MGVLFTILFVVGLLLALLPFILVGIFVTIIGRTRSSQLNIVIAVLLATLVFVFAKTKQTHKPASDSESVLKEVHAASI
jgi:hypothetical protein